MSERSAKAADDELVLGAAVRLIEAAREHNELYAGDFAPLRTDQVSDLLARLNCFVRTFPFQSSAVAFASAPIGGLYPIALNQNATRTDRLFALRHEMAHVLAGEVDEPTYLTEDGVFSHSERAADLFALADLIAARNLRLFQRWRWPRRQVREVVRGCVRIYAEGWPEERVNDRAELRMRLFKECGI